MSEQQLKTSQCKALNKIKSFEVDHTKIHKGIFISRIDEDIVTYDLRMVQPNLPPFLENAGLHSFEHLLATYVRSSEISSKIVYAGPMGCRTGFYLLTRNIDHATVISTLKETMKFIAEFEGGLPGESEVECGNYLDHDIPKAKEYAREFLDVIKNWTVEMINY
ncbi:s-ribosylhomocysteinase_LuxS [Hexamita inflata]|uniref:S-ribosylhomocysteine lyase n=2 Tax=Hexamita inflata TaxID=28002 RepID=A0AA86P3X1_9EUKA|nr:s-ribosylhomocysteinase LuxS [Hexamita inflata]CAI9946287.1 s-ribosylhomocysteinase LuxS [Hexamita inflata]